MDDLVRQAGVENKGEPHHAAAEQGPRRQAVAGGQEVFDHRELGERVGAEELPVEGQVPAHGCQVAGGERGVIRSKEGQQLDAVEFLRSQSVLSGGQRQPVQRKIVAPFGHGHPVAGMCAEEAAGGNGQHTLGGGET